MDGTPLKTSEAAKSTAPARSHRRSPIDSAINPALSQHNAWFDPAYAKSVSRHVIGFLDRLYFRSQLIGFDDPEVFARNRPETPLILAGNHSGMSFPWDAIILAGRLLREAEYDFSRSVRPLTAPLLSAQPIMNPYGLQNFWRRAGCVDAALPNFEGLMQDSRANVLIYPEGIAGIGKGFDRRYQLQRFSNSFLRMALKHESDIQPILTVNGEYLDPLGYHSDFVDRLVQKLGIPFLPLGPLTTLIPAHPWSFYFSLPARLTYVRGRRIRLREMTDADPERISQRELNRLRNAVQAQMQEDLNAAVSQYGADPFHIDELLETWYANRDRLAYALPHNWPVLFHEHERRFQENQPVNGAEREGVLDHANWRHAFAALRNAETWAYNTPFLGWLPVLWRNWMTTQPERPGA